MLLTRHPAALLLALPAAAPAFVLRAALAALLLLLALVLLAAVLALVLVAGHPEHPPDRVFPRAFRPGCRQRDAPAPDAMVAKT